jgi:hypothetical protein
MRIVATAARLERNTLSAPGTNFDAAAVTDPGRIGETGARSAEHRCDRRIRGYRDQP